MSLLNYTFEFLRVPIPDSSGKLSLQDNRIRNNIFHIVNTCLFLIVSVSLVGLLSAVLFLSFPRVNNTVASSWSHSHISLALDLFKIPWKKRDLCFICYFSRYLRNVGEHKNRVSPYCPSLLSGFTMWRCFRGTIPIKRCIDTQNRNLFELYKQELVIWKN